MKKIFITGISGMIGTMLSNHLTEQGFEVSGLSRSTSHSRLNNVKHYQGDILDKGFLSKTFSDYQPDIVFHLAAQAFNGRSWDFEDTTYLTNIQGSRNVFETCRDHGVDTVIPACSSAEYGWVKVQPIGEEEPLRPVSPYGVTKAAMEMMGRQFAMNYGMKFIFPRLFIHVGINHPPATAVQNFARQFAAKKNEVFVGNLSSYRDYVDVEDGVRALELLMYAGKTLNVYNICSGVVYKTEDIITMFKEISGYSPTIKTTTKLFRHSDEPTLHGNPAKINELGWKATTPFYETLTKVYNNWKERL